MKNREKQFEAAAKSVDLAFQSALGLGRKYKMMEPDQLWYLTSLILRERHHLMSHKLLGDIADNTDTGAMIFDDLD